MRSRGVPPQRRARPVRPRRRGGPGFPAAAAGPRASGTFWKGVEFGHDRQRSQPRDVHPQRRANSRVYARRAPAPLRRRGCARGHRVEGTRERSHVAARVAPAGATVRVPVVPARARRVRRRVLVATPVAGENPGRARVAVRPAAVRARRRGQY